MEGVFANGSAFTNTPAHEIYRTLIRHGFAPTGKEYLTSGITGEALQTYIFCGPIYYQKLKHMVVDKVQARAQGHLQALTRQPTEGRAKEGGLRVGEMERDCIIAHGAAKFLKERLFEVSDACRVHVCDTCGLFAVANLQKNLFQCTLCRDKAKISQITLPYAAKLLIQELMTMNIASRLVLYTD